MRRNKGFSIIGLRKYEDKPQYFHCKIHKDVRLIRIKDKWICPVSCGPTYAATRTVLAM